MHCILGSLLTVWITNKWDHPSFVFRLAYVGTSFLFPKSRCHQQTWYGSVTESPYLLIWGFRHSALLSLGEGLIVEIYPIQTSECHGALLYNVTRYAAVVNYCDYYRLVSYYQIFRLRSKIQPLEAHLATGAYRLQNSRLPNQIVSLLVHLKHGSYLIILIGIVWLV